MKKFSSLLMWFLILFLVAAMELGLDASIKQVNQTRIICVLQVEPGNGLGFQSLGDDGKALESMAEMLVSGCKITITTGNAQIDGTLVGGTRSSYHAGSYIIWNSMPQEGQDLSGTFRFVLDNGMYEGTIKVPGADVSGGSPYSIQSMKSVFIIEKR